MSLRITVLLFALSGPVIAQQAGWEVSSPMPTPREKLASCAIGQHIYAIGGAAGENQPGLGIVERLDTINGHWSTDATIPTPRRSLTASAVEGICYAIGGRANINAEIYDSVEAFDTETGIWSARAAMPTARFQSASAVIDGKIYVVGGVSVGIGISDALEVYNPTGNSWTSLPAMPTPRLALGAVAVDGKLYAMGGTYSPGFQDYDVVEVYNPTSEQWSTVAPMPLARTGMVAVAVDHLIYVIGGGRLSQALSSVQIYDTSSDSWSEGPSLLEGRVRFAAAKVAGTMFAIGGTHSVRPPHPGISSVETLEIGSDGTPFQINAGLNDAWFNPDTPGQGFFITVFPDIGAIFLAWFTYDTERPPVNATAILGEPGHRWLTAYGNYADNLAVLDIEVTSGGIFDSAEPMTVQESDGDILLEFSDCENGTVSYDIASLDLQGEIPIKRIALDNVPGCEEYSGSE